MKWIPEYLKKNVTETIDDQTLYIDLPKNEQIGWLQLELSMQGVATPRTTTTLIDKLGPFEVIADGSKVLYSLEPELAYYIDFVTNGGVYPAHSFNYTPNARELHEFIIPFGRFRGDEKYLLDTGLYNSVQLRIPYSTDGTHFTTQTFRSNIVMWRPHEKVTEVIGVIRSRTVRKETSTSAGTVTHDLPTTYPLHLLAARVEDVDVNLATSCTAVKVNMDAGRDVLLDLNINEIRDWNKTLFPERNYYQIVPAATDATAFTAHVDYPYVRALFSSGVRALIFKLSAAAGQECTLNVYEADGTAASGGHAVTIQVGGPHPHQCMLLVDGREQPFDVTAYSEGEVEYTLAAQTIIMHTFLQEMVAGKLT